MDEHDEHEDCKAYKDYVHGRLEALAPIFARATIGDFSKNIEIPDENDDFARFYAGIQVMLEVIHAQVDKLTSFNEELERKVKERTQKLEEANAELKKINEFTLGRELKMIELKGEIKRLEDERDSAHKDITHS